MPIPKTYNCLLQSSLAALPRLLELRLDNNQFDGEIPDMKQGLKIVNISYNNLQGPIPPGLGKITAAMFQGTTVLDAIKATIDPTTNVIYEENPDANFVKDNDFSYVVVVVGEPPYAERAGDNLNLTILAPGPSIIQNVCGAVKCVVVIISGRPLVIEPFIGSMDAVVAAWLPGSEGQGVVDVLFGDYGFSGKLPRTWFKSVDQLPMNVGYKYYDPLFPFGFGLSTSPLIQS